MPEGSNPPLRDEPFEREFRYGPSDFRAIATILREEAGIALPEGKATLVYARLAKRLRNLGLDDFSDYVRLLQGPNSAPERRTMLSAMTTNHTRFFREPHHFDHLRSTILEPLAQQETAGRFRLWSAACSTGQEAYSIAAIVADALPNVPRMDIKILATDIDPAVIEQARRGRYDSIDGVPPGMRRWFKRDGEQWSADPSLHSLITFKCLNLIAQWPVRGPFDVIFCRNVAIYFDQDVQSRLWSSFASVMPSGGTLYIGHSERVIGPAIADFHNIGITTYQRSAGP